MLEHLTIAELVEQVLADLKRLAYAQNTQLAYRRFYNRVLHYAKLQGVEHYSEAFGQKFFEATYGCQWTELPQPIPKKFRPPVRFLASLTDVQLHGTVVRRRPKNRPYEAPPAFGKALDAFTVECQRRGYSPYGQRTRMGRIRLFLAFLASENVTPDTLTARHVSRYVTTLMNYNPKTVLAILTNLRTFLRFLHDAGFHAQDLSGAVPRVRAGRYERLPSVWPADTVQRLLNAVDRGNPTGKRDYAILLLAARLGMRVGDIKALTLSALHWESKTITWVQQKTGRAIEYPLLDDVGWAIIDYLKYGRPATTSPVLFVRHYAPFEPFGSHANLHHIITRYVRRAGISVPAGHHGMHALRHTLASTLLERETPLPVIAEILGHLSTQSTQVYLAVNREGLERCALDPEEVFAYGDE
ncbi:site-specific integrase [Kyrpidia tusciae]|uniref:Integrase family protein n=1 Tax=Kyrpidia tusciae (strain DSM 2912 / NBRC 15312 / T2) TaxID=562970 RepID=D5WUE4_KYRT2|nr:site-specific integrase [Kyrpidia tusciae]ADG07396.1 integrase family protein [Kyrpidia tusciae DSM 2912]